MPSYIIKQTKKDNTNDKIGLILSTRDNVEKGNMYNLPSVMEKAPFFILNCLVP